MGLCLQLDIYIYIYYSSIFKIEALVSFVQEYYDFFKIKSSIISSRFNYFVYLSSIYKLITHNNVQVHLNKLECCGKVHLFQ